MSSLSFRVIGGASDDPSVTCGSEPVGDLDLESTYIWGLFRTRGDEPHIVQVQRRLAPTDSWPPRLLLQSNFGVSGMRRHRIEPMPARSRDIQAIATDAGRAFNVEPHGVDQPFELAVGHDSLRWSEGIILDVSGAEITPGLQWCLMIADDQDDAMRYVSRTFQVSGVFEGSEVDGFVGLDEIFLPPGRQYLVDDPFTVTQLSEAWCSWATAYDDGTVECGQLAFGADGFGFALRADGDARVAGRVTGKLTVGPDGCPTHIGVDLDGEAWEFVADPRGLPTEPLPGPVHQAEGWFRRVGETRRPVVWCATPEIPAIDPESVL